jgi:hypothetical protein
VGVFWCIVLYFLISLFDFIDFYFILACLYIYVLLVFSFRCLFQCLFVCLFISFVFPFVFIYLYVTVLYHFFFESISCSKTRLSYSVCLLIDCIRCILEHFSSYLMFIHISYCVYSRWFDIQINRRCYHNKP